MNEHYSNNFICFFIFMIFSCRKLSFSGELVKIAVKRLFLPTRSFRGGALGNSLIISGSMSGDSTRDVMGTLVGSGDSTSMFGRSVV